MSKDKPKLDTVVQFDIAGMVERALQDKDYDSAIKAVLEGVLTVNQNFENIAAALNNHAAALRGVVSAMATLSAHMKAMDERLVKLETKKPFGLVKP